MRRYLLFLALGVAISAVKILGQGHAPSIAPREERSVSAASSAPPLRYQGVATCASKGCHHDNGRRGDKGSEYTTWISGDPHARAFRVLFDRRSQDIEAKLNNSSIKPHEDPLCLNCHVQPGAKQIPRADHFSFRDGVGCESCHGPAEKWLTIHYTAAWKGREPDQKKAAGMYNTKNLLKRAELCVPCHVGRQQDEVNHDLIAAGHPRLWFEYASYLARYPARHWKLDGETNSEHGRYPDFEARAWLVGQVVSARAAVDLLKYRAQSKQHPWPDFSEYGCFGCHHDLHAEGWRQKETQGTLRWGSWYFASLALLSDSTAPQPRNLQHLEELAQIMVSQSGRKRAYSSYVLPDRDQVIWKAQQVFDLLDAWSTDLEKEDQTKQSLNALLARLVPREPLNGRGDWEGAVQRVLGIRAIYDVIAADSRREKHQLLDPGIHQLEEVLSRAFARDQDVRFASPFRYDPKELDNHLLRLRRQIDSRGP